MTMDDMDEGITMVVPSLGPRVSIGRTLLSPTKPSGDVLITELADDQTTTDSEAEYDTDLENEAAKDFEAKHMQSQLYRKVCLHFGVTPASYYLRHINDTELVMKHQGLGPKGTKALTVPLQVNTHIHSLNLQGNWMGAEGVRHVAFMLQENNSLTVLNLSYNRLRSNGARVICRALHQNPYIKSVDLSGNGITDHDAKYICELLEKTTALQRLNLSNNGLCEEGVISLGKAIGVNNTLISLNLSWNHIRQKGAEAIANGLKENSHLTEFDLSMNGFARTGTEFLAAALEVNTTLKTLDISSNRIDQGGCIALARALLQNTTLRILMIGLNAMTFYGTLDLIQHVENNPNSGLEFIDLRSSLVSIGFMDEVEKIQNVRRFSVRVGHVTTSPSQRTVADDAECNDQNPLEILLLFMSEKNLRLLDLFKSLDKDQSGSLSREEFIDGLQSVDTPLSKSQLDELITMLDKDGDGEIDLTEILNINREFKDVKRKVTRQIQAKKLKTAVGLAGTLSRIGSALSNVSNAVSAVSATNSEINDDKLDIPDDGPVYSNQLLVPGM